jgi:hypothetical protein
VADVVPGTEPTARSWFADELAQTTASWANARGCFEQIGRSNYRKTDVILETTVEKLYEARLRVRDCQHSPGFGTVAVVLQKTGCKPLNGPSLPASDALLTDRTIRLRLQPGSAWKVNLIYFADDVREKAEALKIKSQNSDWRTV